MKKFLSCFSVLLALTVLVSCGGDTQGDIETGTWSDDGKTFTNSWSDIAFTLGEGWYALSSEEMGAQIAVGEEVLINDGKGDEVDAARLKTAYDFMIVSDGGLPNVTVSYENLAASPGGASLDEEDYYAMVLKQLMDATSMKYAEIGTATRTIAGKEYFSAFMTFYGGKANQDYYLRKIDSVMMCVIVTYTEETRQTADEWLESVTAAK